jgi:DNA-binding LacI/PurR family transcriptional regulator
MVEQPRLALGRMAAETVLARIAERRAGKARQPPRVIRLEAEVVVPDTDTADMTAPPLRTAVHA